MARPGGEVVRQVEQAGLFHEVRLEEWAPGDHLVGRVDAIGDLSFVREPMAEHYSRLGRPSICPELMPRMLVGYWPSRPRDRCLALGGMLR